MDDETKAKLKLVREIAENLMGAFNAVRMQFPDDTAESNLFLGSLGVTLDTACVVFAGLDSSGMSYEDVVDYCTGELGEEMDGSDE